MAVNLVKAGYTVTGFDVVPAALDAAREHGIPTAGRPRRPSTGAGVVLTMLPSGQHVLDAYRGAGGQPGLLETAAPGTMFLDCSTINVDEAREAAGTGGRRRPPLPWTPRCPAAWWGPRPAR